jgi:hypothetical protein
MGERENRRPAPPTQEPAGEEKDDACRRVDANPQVRRDDAKERESDHPNDPQHGASGKWKQIEPEHTQPGNEVDRTAVAD